MGTITFIHVLKGLGKHSVHYAWPSYKWTFHHGKETLSLSSHRLPKILRERWAVWKPYLLQAGLFNWSVQDLSKSSQLLQSHVWQPWEENFTLGFPVCWLSYLFCFLFCDVPEPWGGGKYVHSFYEGTQDDFSWAFWTGSPLPFAMLEGELRAFCIPGKLTSIGPSHLNSQFEE